MNINAKESIITPNDDGTYKIEFPNMDFTDVDGNLIKGTILIPRVQSNLIENSNGEYSITPLCEPATLETVGDTIFTIKLPEGEQ